MPIPIPFHIHSFLVVAILVFNEILISQTLATSDFSYEKVKTNSCIIQVRG